MGFFVFQPSSRFERDLCEHLYLASKKSNILIITSRKSKWRYKIGNVHSPFHYITTLVDGYEPIRSYAINVVKNSMIHTIDKCIGGGSLDIVVIDGNLPEEVWDTIGQQLRMESKMFLWLNCPPMFRNNHYVYRLLMNKLIVMPLLLSYKLP
jgi:hypothetical protein